MKANELMIGDWVQDRSGSKMKIMNIEYHCTRVLYNGEELILACFEQANLRPIPLTTEILEKNGWRHEFDKTDYMVKYDLGKEGKNCWMMWAVKEHNLDIQRQDENLYMYNLKVSKVVIPCDYVHELQHALRLCGITREIIL